MNTTTRYGPSTLILAVLASAGCAAEASVPRESSEPASASVAGAEASQPIPVSGSAFFHATTAIVHSEEPTEQGMVQRSTAVVRLTGDVSGWVLYHFTSTFDFAAGTLVNMGRSTFSGTIAGSDPVVLTDDRGRFEVDLSTEETTGEVHLSAAADARNTTVWVECRLDVVGTGRTPDGDETSDYTGECTRRGNLDAP